MDPMAEHKRRILYQQGEVLVKLTKKIGAFDPSRESGMSPMFIGQTQTKICNYTTLSLSQVSLKTAAGVDAVIQFDRVLRRIVSGR